MDNRDTIIIAISIAKAAEEQFLKECKWVLNTDWEYAMTNGTDFDMREVSNYSFVLINSKKWHDDNVRQLVSSMPSEKKKIIWLHDTCIGEFSINKDQIASLNENIEFVPPFAHRAGRSDIEEFMRHISSGANYRKEFEKLLEASVKKKQDLRLLSLLLPLDVDMQVLDILCEEKDESRAVQYLKDILTGAEDRHYKSTFAKVKDLGGKCADGKIQACLEGLLGKSEAESILHGLLELLDGLKMNVDQLNYDDVQSISNYFRNTSKDRYETFHGWYDELSRCLQGGS